MFDSTRVAPRVVLHVDRERYREVNQHLREIWSRYAPAVEVASFDEAYLELTGCEALDGLRARHGLFVVSRATHLEARPKPLLAPGGEQGDRGHGHGERR